MPSILILGAALVAVIAFSDALAGRLRIPVSIALVLVGVGLSFVPGAPPIRLNPTLVLLLFLPPLIYWSGVGMSWRGFRNNLRPILLLAIGCVLFTATAVAGVGHWFLGMPWAVAFVLGAVVSPPDTVAPMAVARRLKAPSRLMTILEGEGLANDATALILLSFALGAVAHGGISLPKAAGAFALILVGELAWGCAVGWAMLRIRARANNPEVEMILSLLTPYLAFWPPHVLGGSGVLAALAAGLYVSWRGRRLISPPTRLQGYFVWGLAVHVLEGLLFLLTGLQARTLAAGPGGDGWTRFVLAGVLVSLVVIVVRFVWVFPATYLPHWLFAGVRRREPRPPWRDPFVVGFTGIRGAVSLIAALSIPTAIAGAAFPDRDLILFVTFCVIIVTLVGEGGLLPLVFRRTGLVAAGEAEAARAKAREVAARIEGVEAVLAELSRLESEEGPADAIANLRRPQEDRLAVYLGTADPTVNPSPAIAISAVQGRLIEAERRRIAEIYDRGDMTDEARRRVERELDLEDARNRHAFESATGDSLADPATEAQQA